MEIGLIKRMTKKGPFSFDLFFSSKKFGGFQPCSAYLRAGFGRLHFGALVVRVVGVEVLGSKVSQHHVGHVPGQDHVVLTVTLILPEAFNRLPMYRRDLRRAKRSLHRP